MEYVLVLLFVVVVISAALYGLRVVREYERLIIFRLGRCLGEKGPGLVIVWPIIDTAVTVDLRENVQQIPHQTCITKDNAPISIDFLVYLRIVDPVESVVRISNLPLATTGIATTTLRAVIGDLPLDEVLARRDHINQVLQAKLDEVTVRWGVKVTTVEIREIEPPREVQEAMNRQMSAERNRRATVTEAEGKRESSVMVAEGAKQASILEAEGERQAAILRAEAERQSAILRAEGFSLALERIYSIARTVDGQTMQLQYFETLKALGESPATKFIFPMEFTSLLGRFASRSDQGAPSPTGGNPP